MSTNEYHNLFLKCQGTGKYHMFCFDRVNSRLEDPKIKQGIQEKMIELMNSIYSSIQEIEKQKNIKILVQEEGFVSFDSKERPKGFGNKREPFVYGDFVVFYHEERLYSVRHRETDVVALVFANNPNDAIMRVKGALKERESNE